MCGLTLMCHTLTRSALLSLEAQRVGQCNKTSCSKWAPPIDICMNAPACDNAQNKFAPGTLNLEQCAPPKVIKQAGQIVVQDCCDTCDNPCANVPCNNEPPSPADCGQPTWPLCKPFKVEKTDAFQCCKSCVDVCKSNNLNCGAPPTEQECASQGKILGPKSPSSCCLGCVQPCDSVQCPNLVTREQCESQGLKYVFKTPAEAAVSKLCYDCCPRCEGGTTTTASKIKTEPSSASTVVAALAIVVVATFSML
jgi:hypothetical protein